MDFWPKFIDKTTKTARALASASVIFYVLPWLMVLMILGTVSQKWMGIYETTHMYFNSVIFWLGPVPLPGGLATIGMIFIALATKFLFFSKWNRAQAGIILTHLGILLLLLGGIVTAGTSKEGFMIIPEGRNVDSLSDYRQRVINITPDKGDTIIIPFDELYIDQEIPLVDLGITLKVLEACENCSARAPSGQYKDLQGLAQNMELFAVPSEANKETNFSGAILALIKSPDKNQHGTYIVMEDIPKNPIFKTAAGEAEISLSRAITPLPFSITLKDFRKIDYPGTNKARAFESDIIVQDNELSWPATVSMNNPLRYKGYSFYQSSFDQRDGMEVTVLNVVKNSGRAFPYISSLVIFLGLLLHFIIRLQTSGNNRKAAS